ncbi:dihydroorotase [Clostridia bacterium]|nr:dihydroorotase [Clostridia bacterium]
MTILLKNGIVTDSKNGIAEEPLDILITNANISEVERHISPDKAEEIIDCTGLHVIPGIFDMHVHLRDPGQAHKESVFTGAKAAQAGGITGMLCMPNTVPVLDSPYLIDSVMKKCRWSGCKTVPASALTIGQRGEHLPNFRAIKEAGAVAATDDGRPVSDFRVMKAAMIAAHEAGLKVISHSEDLRISGNGIINEGAVSEALSALGVKGINRLSESLSVSREILLSEETGVPIHIAHVSTKESVQIIRDAKRRGVKVTCETAPHYFSLTEESLYEMDADYRMNPPLRTVADKEAIIAGLTDGTIDAIATDHAPHSAAEKKDFLSAPNGVIGLETSLAVTLTKLYHTGKLSISEIVWLMCVSPRNILGIGGGGLAVGADADIAVFKAEQEWTVRAGDIVSRSRNTCFKNMKLKGKVKYTFLNGRRMYRG